MKKIFKFSILKLSCLLLALPLVSANLTSGEATIIFGSIFSLIIVAIFFLVISIMSGNIPIKIFFLGLASLTILSMVGVGVSVMQDFFSDFTNLIIAYGGFYRLLLIGIGAGAIALILWLIVVAVKSFWKMRGMSDSEFDED